MILKQREQKWWHHKTKSMKLWEWLEFSARTRWKVFTCQKAAANWWGDVHCKQCYALITL